MFVIVKYASAEFESQWGEFKPSEGVFANHSIHDTYTGKGLGVKPYYVNKEEAEKDLLLAIEANPTVGYAVCPVLSFWSDRVQEIFLSAFASMRPTPPTMKVLVRSGNGKIIETTINGFHIKFDRSQEKPVSVITNLTFNSDGGCFLFLQKDDIFALSIDF